MEDFQQGLERDPVFLSEISQVVRHGFTGIVQEPSRKFNSPSALHPKLQDKFTQIGRASTVFFVSCTELCFVNLFHKDSL
jgi:hypothetical protein